MRSSSQRLTLLLSLLSFLLPLCLMASPASAFHRPDLGRWAKRDPVGYVDGSNLYEYATSMPTTHQDPTGTCAFSCNYCVPNPDFAPTPNGCSVPLIFNVPPSVIQAFTSCCNAHDLCYQTCQPGPGHSGKARCDSEFATCLSAVCGSPNPPDNCHNWAKAFYTAVYNFGGTAFEADQRHACTCCDGPGMKQADCLRSSPVDPEWQTATSTHAPCRSSNGNIPCKHH